MSSKTRRRWSPQQKADFVRRFAESGSSQREFAESIGIHPNLLATWVRLARNGKLPDPTPLLLPVRVKPDAQPVPPAPPVEIVLRGGRTVRVQRGFDAETLGRVVEVLEQC